MILRRFWIFSSEILNAAGTRRSRSRRNGRAKTNETSGRRRPKGTVSALYEIRDVRQYDAVKMVYNPRVKGGRNQQRMESIAGGLSQ
jgi:hypothetical protein